MRRISVGAALITAFILVTGCGHSTTVIEGFVPITTVPPSTTTTTADPCPQTPVSTGETVLASPKSWNLPYSATPGGPKAGVLKENWGGLSTRPVLAAQNGWLQIRLESRPNGSSGWIPLQDVTVSTTMYHIVISICHRSLTLYQGPTAVYSAPVGVGQARWPTPTGPSFVDSIVNTPARQQYIYGPTVLIMGTHSNVFTEFDGGDGTVAIHGYPSDPASTKGVMSSHGCVRASPDTINAIKVVPVGTPIDVVA